MKLKLLHFVLLITAAVSCTGQQNPAIETVDASVFAEKLRTENNPQLIDVRTPAEYEQQKIAGAQNINYNAEDFLQKAANLDKTKPVYVYCKSGGRSGQAAEELQKMGFSKIYDLDGGILKWNAAGFAEPVSENKGITVQEFKKLTSANDEVLVVFSATWCAPCKKMKPYLNKMQSESPSDRIITMLDADANASLLTTLKIDVLPTLMFYKNNVLAWTHSGYLSEDELKAKLQ